ncbi:MAG: hypothetical protein CMM94_03755 [Rickettsiales bacterium]|nr:hypothetical protein [Rickettsiales bacterium]
MSKAPIMPFYTDAYLADTHHLSTEAHGAYLLMLLYSWRHNGIPLPDDDTQLARIARLTPRKWHSMRPLLRPFYTLEDGHWHQAKLARTWAEVMAKREAASRNGKRGNAVRRQKAKQLNLGDTAAANASHPPTPSINHKPLNHKPESDPSDDALANQPALSTEPPDTPALDAFRPILSDMGYFLPDGKQLHHAMHGQLATAVAEAAQLVRPATPSQIRSAIARLFAHFPKADHALIPDYAAVLHPYPPDLIALACSRLLATHAYATPPRIADLTAQIDGEFQRRQATARKLERLQAHHSSPPVTA